MKHNNTICNADFSKMNAKSIYNSRQISVSVAEILNAIFIWILNSNKLDGWFLVHKMKFKKYRAFIQVFKVFMERPWVNRELPCSLSELVRTRCFNVHFTNIKSNISLHFLYSHYENTPIQIYRTFHLQKLKIFKRKILSTIYVFSRNKKNNVYPCKPQFYYIKVGFKGFKII